MCVHRAPQPPSPYLSFWGLSGIAQLHPRRRFQERQMEARPSDPATKRPRRGHRCQRFKDLKRKPHAPLPTHVPDLADGLITGKWASGCVVAWVDGFVVCFAWFAHLSLSANKHKSGPQTTGRENNKKHAKRKSAGLHDGFSMALDASACKWYFVNNIHRRWQQHSDCAVGVAVNDSDLGGN